MRRLEIAVVFAILIGPLGAQTRYPATNKEAPVGGEVAEPQEKNADRFGSQVKDQDKEGDAERYAKEMKDLAEQLRTKVKELAKSVSAQRQKLDEQLNKIRAEMETARAEAAKQVEGEDPVEREMRRREAAQTLSTLTRQERDITNEIRTRVNEAQGKAQEWLRSTSSQYDKLRQKLRAFGDSKVAEEALEEFSRAQTETRRLLSEVIGMTAEAMRTMTPRGGGSTTAVPGQPQAQGARMPGGAGQGLAPLPAGPGGGGGFGGPGGAQLPGARTGARPGGAPAAGGQPDAAPPAGQAEDKTKEAMRGRIEEYLHRAKGAQGAAPEPAPQQAGSAPNAAGGRGGRVPEQDEVVKLQTEIQELRKEIRALQETLKSLLKERAKEEPQKDPAPQETRKDPAAPGRGMNGDTDVLPRPSRNWPNPR